MQLVGRIAVGRPADAGLQVGQVAGDQGLQRHPLPRLQPHHQGKGLLPVRCGTGLQEVGAVLVDNQLRHRVGAAEIPVQALGQRRIQPPAHPLHRHRQHQGLGDRQPERPFDVAGIEDHGFAAGEGQAELPVDLRFHLRPAAQYAGIAIELLTNRGAGDDPHGGLIRPLQVAGQDPRCGALAAGRRADQQVEAGQRCLWGRGRFGPLAALAAPPGCCC